MIEALAKRTRAGHKAATRTVRQIEEIVAAKEPDKARLGKVGNYQES